MKRVLCVIDDDPEMTELVRFLLAEQELEIEATCSTAEEAVKLVKDNMADLVILDHFIDGDVMGLEAAALIKQARPEVKIILLSSHDLAVEADREPAIDAFVPKSRLDDLVPTSLRLLDI
ncbi:MAG TPA: response regulator [Actinomycetota bacterium]|nr:response regulator [Actinomycetota bacterium]